MTADDKQPEATLFGINATTTPDYSNIITPRTAEQHRAIWEDLAKSLSAIEPIRPTPPPTVGPQMFREMVELKLIDEQGRWLPQSPTRTERKRTRKPKRHR